LVVCYVLGQFPFDVVGGYTLPVVYGRREAGFGSWFAQWTRGTWVHGAVLAAVGSGVLWAGQAAGLPGALGLMAAVALVLVALQGPLGRGVSYLPKVTLSPTLIEALKASDVDEARVSVLKARDTSFVGGWVGVPGFERLVVSSRWLEMADPTAMGILVERRRLGLASGARLQGLAAALAFNAVGVGLALTVMPGTGVGSAGELMLLSTAVTLWSFLGLLTLPTLSRRAVYALDRQVADGVDDPMMVARLISRLDRDQEDELDRTRVVETIFHPVPAPAQRAMALRYPPVDPPRFIPWRVARMSLFTSWASLSLLSRAVHCNIGRPDLWVMYPGD
jgi:hypothetical protein